MLGTIGSILGPSDPFWDHRIHFALILPTGRRCGFGVSDAYPFGSFGP